MITPLSPPRMMLSTTSPKRKFLAVIGFIGVKWEKAVSITHGL